MARVYLETSFFSACVAGRADAASVFRKQESQRWWTLQRSVHELSLSAEVLRELSDPAFAQRDVALAMTAGLNLLPLDNDVVGFAKILVREQVMPGPESSGDSLHVAAATVHSMEYLLTWNVKHLANMNKVRHLQEVCRRVGYAPPAIVTPDLLWT
jgi:predicted nucleic acid-binding protein